jgi:hypothetical protein
MCDTPIVYRSRFLLTSPDRSILRPKELQLMIELAQVKTINDLKNTERRAFQRMTEPRQKKTRRWVRWFPLRDERAVATV